MADKALAQAISSKRAIIFDVFHTLTALEITVGEDRPKTHQILGVSRDAWNDQLERLSRDRITGRQSDAVAIVAQMARAINPAITNDLIEAATRNRIANFAAALVHMPTETGHVLHAMKAKGKRIGLISNADIMEVAAWNQCPMAGLFDSTVFSCHVGCSKPEPEIYRISLRELGVGPGEAVFVGDGGSGELEGARSLGITTVMITGIIQGIWPEKIPQRRRHADFVIERLSELLDA